MLEQQTPEWYAWRNNHIGSSDAPAILGVSPWKTRYQLWREKVENLPPEDSTPAMRRGLFLEDAARQAHFEMTGVMTAPKCLESKEYPFMAASLDGINSDGSLILEIKCPNGEDHEMAKRGMIPRKYFPQIQHQMIVADVRKCHYFSFDGSEGALVEVERDSELIAELIAEEKEFWRQVTEMDPPPLAEADYVSREDDEWKELAAAFILIDSEEKSAADRKKKLRADILAIAAGQNCRGGGVRVRYQKKEGSLDTEKLAEVVDLAQYRKPPSLYPVVGIDLKSG